MANFIPLTVGLNAATTALGGPKITISTFKIGSSNSAVVASQTGLQGSQLYAGSVTQVYPVSDNTVNVVVQIPAAAGPFNFGEVLLELDNGTAFARLAYATLQEKISSTVSGLGATWTLNCLLKLGHLAGTLNYTSKITNEVMTLDGGSVVSPQELSSSSAQANLVIGKFFTGEYLGVKSPIILSRLSNSEWDPHEYEYFATITAQAGTTNSVFATNWFNFTVRKHLDSRGYHVLLQTSNGRMMTGVVDVTTGNLNLASPCSWSVPGVQVRMYYYESNNGAVITQPLLRGRSSIEPIINSPAYEIGIRGTPSRFWSGAENIEHGNGIRWTFSGGNFPLPNISDVAFESVAAAGWETTVFNTSLTEKVTVSAPLGGNFIVLGRYQGIGNAGSPNSIEIGPRGNVKFSYATGSTGAWGILVEGHGILGHNYGGDFIIGAIYHMPHATALPGFRAADGGLYQQTGLPEAFAVLGTAFNNSGDPGGLFRMPDARGYFIRSTDGGSGRDPGRLVNTFQQDAVKDHIHQLQMKQSMGDNGHIGSLVLGAPFDYEPTATAQDLDPTSLAKSPAGAAPENRVKNLAQNAYVFVAR